MNENYMKTDGYKIGNCLTELGYENFIIIGSPDRSFYRAGNIWDAENGMISFCHRKRVKNIIETINLSKASIVITNKDIASSELFSDNKTIVLIDEPRKVLIDILNKYLIHSLPFGEIHPSAIIHPEANIHSTVSIGAYCVIGKCSIDEKTVIFPNVTINDNVIIGKHVIINPSTVIGYDGFGFSKNEDGSLEKFPHFGGVTIKDYVEIGSNVSIDRGSLSDTIIQEGSKIDNFSHIAHNVNIGKNCQIIAHSMIGGSTIIGDQSHIAPAGILRDCLNWERM